MTNRTFEQVNSPLIVSVIKRARETLKDLVLSPEIALGNIAIGQIGLKLSLLTSLELSGDWLKSSAVKDLGNLNNLEHLSTTEAVQKPLALYSL